MEKYTVLKGRVSQGGRVVPPSKFDDILTPRQIEKLIKKKIIKLNKVGKDTSDGKEQAAVDK